MKELILSSNKILIVLPENLDVDSLAAGLGLAYIIKSFDKDVSLGYTDSIPEEFFQILDLSNFKQISSIKQSEVVLSLNKKKGGVKAVRWREIEDKIQFIITPESDDFEFNDVDLSSTGGDYDLAICIGCLNLDKVGNLYSSNHEFFNRVTIINIDIHAYNSNFGKINKIGSNNSLAGWIFDLAESEGFSLDKNAVEPLFKGIFWANEGFRQNGNLKKALKKLTSTNGELSSIIYQMFDTLTIAELRYLGKIISNMNIDSEGIIISKIPHNEFQGVKIDRIIYPEINIISRVRDYKVAIIISEYEKGRLSIRIYSKDQTVNIFQLFQEYTPIGNSRRITFSLDGELDEVAQKLLDQLKSSTPIQTVTKNQDERIIETKKEDEVSTNEKKEDEPLKTASSIPEAIDESPEYQMPQIDINSPIQQQAFNPTPPIYPSQPLPPAHPF